MKIFGCLFVLLFLVFIVAFSLLRGVFRMFFGSRTNAGGRPFTASGREERANSSASASSATTPKKKVIGEDEGEYVDFEEVK